MTHWGTKLLFAIIAALAIFWQSFAGPLEHLGIVPHAHPITTLAEPGDLGSAYPDLVDHHHLPDLYTTVPFECPQIAESGRAPAIFSFSPPVSPVFDIICPPQRI